MACSERAQLPAWTQPGPPFVRHGDRIWLEGSGQGIGRNPGLARATAKNRARGEIASAIERLTTVVVRRFEHRAEREWFISEEPEGDRIWIKWMYRWSGPEELEPLDEILLECDPPELYLRLGIDLREVLRQIATPDPEVHRRPPGGEAGAALLQEILAEVETEVILPCWERDGCASATGGGR